MLFARGGDISSPFFCTRPTTGSQKDWRCLLKLRTSVLTKLLFHFITVQCNLQKFGRGVFVPIKHIYLYGLSA